MDVKEYVGNVQTPKTKLAKELNCPNFLDLTTCVYKSSIILDFQEMRCYNLVEAREALALTWAWPKAFQLLQGHLLSVAAQSSIPKATESVVFCSNVLLLSKATHKHLFPIP